MAVHSHPSVCTSKAQTSSVPSNAVLASGPAVYSSPASGNALAPGSITFAGGGIAHNNVQPSLTLNWAISLEGIYPSQG